MGGCMGGDGFGHCVLPGPHWALWLCTFWGGILLPWMGRCGHLHPLSCVFWEGAGPPLKYILTEIFFFLLSLLAEIYRIVSQRQITGQPESEFGPTTTIEPIRVLPTQQEGRQAPCCQNI